MRIVKFIDDTGTEFDYKLCNCKDCLRFFSTIGVFFCLSFGSGEIEEISQDGTIVYYKKGN